MQVQERGLLPAPSEYSIPTCPVNDLSTISTLLPSDAVLPEQFYHTPTYAERHRGVAGLMVAVIEDALKCFCRQFSSHSRRDQRLAREAEVWFFSTDSDYLFSFENICHVLGFDPSAIRGQLKRWRQQPPTTLRRNKRRHPKHEKASFRLAA